MLQYTRRRCAEQVRWCSRDDDVPARCSVRTFECWRYDGIDTAEKDQTYRSTTIDLPPAASTYDLKIPNSNLTQWLQGQESFQRPQAPVNISALRGGLRLLFCERDIISLGIGISEVNFNAIEQAFNLHSATLPAFFTYPGSHGFFYETDPSTGTLGSIWIVVKAPQRSNVANYTLSLHHNVANGWTDAFICGAGAVIDRNVQRPLVGQYEQLTNLILAEPRMWDNPLLLPFVLLNDHTLRMSYRLDEVIWLSRTHEHQIGVTNAGEVLGGFNHAQRTKDFDPTDLSIRLQSISTQLQNFATSYQWIIDYASDIMAASEEVIKSCNNHEIQLKRLMQNTKFLLSQSKGRLGRAESFERRTNLQIKVLSNVTGQEDYLINRQDVLLNFRIAQSSKQDSISMTTFTFITALFLPGTFVATLFSMTMFDWKIGDDASTIGTASSKESYVSDKFWIFWIVAVPLTVATMTSWYFWSKYSKQQWLKELQLAPSQADSLPPLSNRSTFTQHPTLSHRRNSNDTVG